MVVMWYLWALLQQFFSKFGTNFCFLSNYFIMSEEWHKYAQILEREDEEFRRAMQEEVSIISILLNLVINNWILAVARIITQHEKKFLNFQSMLLLSCCNVT